MVSNTNIAGGSAIAVITGKILREPDLVMFPATMAEHYLR
jgi:hypothetical protein